MCIISRPSVLAALLWMSVTPTVGQPLWTFDIDATEAAQVLIAHSDTSSVVLRDIVANADVYHDTAARMLARKATPDDRIFLLDTLNTAVFLSAADLVAAAVALGYAAEDVEVALGHSLDTFDPAVDIDWTSYFLYQDIRGYFGDAEALGGMDTLAVHAPFPLLRLDAISRLADAGWYDHLDVVEGIYLGNDPGSSEHDYALVLLERYGDQPEHAVAVRAILEKGPTGGPGEEPVEEATARAYALAEVDTAAAVAFVEDRLSTAPDEQAVNSYFYLLIGLAPEREPSLVVDAVPRTTDPQLRRDYIPAYDYVVGGVAPASYLAPSFVAFARSWAETETQTLNRELLQERFLDPYRPFFPDASAPVLLDTLRSLTDEAEALRWITPARLADTLRVRLTSAAAALTAGDSARVAYHVAAVQHSVDWAYRYPDSQTRAVTEDGHRFLWWTAQYLLDRLPPPAYPTLADVRPLLECVESNGDGTLTAYFGYDNRDWRLGVVPYGPGNVVAPLSGGGQTSYDGHQPEVFAVPSFVPTALGRTPPYPGHAFTVTFPSTLALEWRLLGRTQTAGASSPACPS